jgi:hypothetical protein
MANSSLQRSRTAGSTKTKFTISMWVKKSANNAKYLMVNRTDDSNRALFQFSGNDGLLFQSKYSNSNNAALETNRKFRDTSGWYHIVLVGDSTLSTAADRTKLYVNGVRETSFASETQIPSGEHYYINEATTNGFRIGEKGDGSDYFDGYISHCVFLDGVAAAYTEFGETDSTSGIWKFKSPSGLTFGTNGFHLKFENSANLGLDSSGQTNNLTVNGNLKQAVDTPSNVYCTMNPLTTTHHTFSNANLSINGSDSKTSVGSLGVNTGKWYWEAKITGSTSLGQYAGATTIENENHWDNAPTSGAADVRTWAGNGNYHNYTQSGNTADSDIISTTGTVYGYALDLDNGTMKYFVNGTLTHTDSTIPSDNSKTFFPVSGTTNSGGGGWQGADYNFGSGNFGTTAITSAGSNGNGSLFEYDVPSGYYALNTKNINTYG